MQHMVMSNLSLLIGVEFMLTSTATRPSNLMVMEVHSHTVVPQFRSKLHEFSGCWDDIERRRQSGVTEQDKNVLRHHPKWDNQVTMKKQKTTANSSPGGKKKAKERL